MTIVSARTIVLLLICPMAWAISDDQRNAAFRNYLQTYRASQPLAVAQIEANWQAHYKEAPIAFVPDSLALLHEGYGYALSAFESRAFEDALDAFEPLTRSEDRFVADNAVYFKWRSMVALERHEQAESAIAALLDSNPELAKHSPYLPHLQMLLAHCQARNLRSEEALETLEVLLTKSDALPEAVLVAARQLMLELQRQGDAPLEKIERLMQYVATRLEAIDTSERTRERQQQIIDLLDAMIEEEEQKEQSQSSSSSSSGQQQQSGEQSGQQQAQGGAQPADRSDERGGPGQIGDLNDAPLANPGDKWGELPPDERERILQDLRERYPTRYRQLVEQYYRSLAEEE